MKAALWSSVVFSIAVIIASAFVVYRLHVAEVHYCEALGDMAKARRANNAAYQELMEKRIELETLKIRMLQDGISK